MTIDFNNTEIAFRQMKESINSEPRNFFQYRACRMDKELIYDIENIKHSVIFAQTPLNMNDPFDSKPGFSAQQIYNDLIDMLVNSLTIDPKLKVVLRLIVYSQAMNTFPETIQQIESIRRFLLAQRAKMHLKYIPFRKFITEKSSSLYNQLPNNLRIHINENDYIAYLQIISLLGEESISETTILSALKLNISSIKLREALSKIANDTFPREREKLLSRLKVSCFSRSGWDNQLMWAHYANSNSGICVEYDFTELNEFIGFILPVEYSDIRPTLSVKDIGIGGINPAADDKIIHCGTDMNRLFSFLLTKNECWKYEKEWRLIKTEDNTTHTFISIPKIASITLGININNICKHIIVDLCLERGIPCYQLSANNDSYGFERIPITQETYSYNYEDEQNYLEHLCNDFIIKTKSLDNIVKLIKSETNKQLYNIKTCMNFLTNTYDVFSDAYFIKLTANRLSKIKDTLINQETIDEMEKMIETAPDNLQSLQTSLNQLKQKGFIAYSDMNRINQLILNAHELINKTKELSWPQLTN